MVDIKPDTDTTPAQPIQAVSQDIKPDTFCPMCGAMLGSQHRPEAVANIAASRFANADFIQHLPRRDCPKAWPHIIDSCGAFEPQEAK